MRILVLVKQVPDITSDRSLTAEGTLVRESSQAVLNELDEGAIESALRAADALGTDGATVEVTALTMGPAGAVAAVKKALQVGAGAAVHVSDEALAGSDAVVTARVLAAAARHLEETNGEPFALVVAGMSALDGLGSVVPALVAAELGRPILSCATSLEVTPESVTATRETPTGSERLRAPLPAVVSVSDTIAALRVPNFATMMAARKVGVTTLTSADLGLQAGEVGAAGSRTRITAHAPRPPRPPAQMLDGAGALVDALDERGLLEVGA